MKKVFTLISVALMAMSANAQEKYVAIERNAETGAITLSEEFKAVLPLKEDGTYGDVATNKTEKGSLVTMKTASVTCVGVGGSTPADVPDVPGDNTATHVDMNADGTVNSWNDIKWQQKNQGDINFAWIQGTGNPSAKITAEVIMQDDIPTTYIDENGVEQTKYRPVYEVYNPDGSLGVPQVGLHYQFTASVAGTIKIGIWVNKGNRKFYVVDGTTAKPIAVRYEGYINGQNETYIKEDGTEANRKKYLSSEEIQAIHDAAKVGEDGVDTAPYIIGAGNQAFWGYVIFEMEAGKTYYVFNDNTQVGFNSWEFTAGATGGDQPGTDTPAADSKLWDFTKTKTADDVFAADATNWENTNGDGTRWTYLPATENAALMVGGAELEDTKGLLFTAKAGKIRVDRDKRLGLNGGGYTLTIPGLKAGQTVTIKSQSANADDAPNRYLEPTNLTVVSGFCSGMENGEITNVGTVTADGDVSVKTVGGINLYSIEVTSGSTGIGNIEVVAPQFNGAIYNLAGQKVGEDYKGIVIKNGKKYINK